MAREYYQERLSDYVDARGDVVPPWERFPDYERYSLGWRMGAGESWLCAWSVFLEHRCSEPDDRLAYLRRHDTAPVPWAGEIYGLLHPSAVEEWEWDDALREERIAEIASLGLVRSDAAYLSWIRRCPDYAPWTRNGSAITAARHDTRSFWFWSRGEGREQTPPARWTSPERPSTSEGLSLLAHLLLAGRVTPPWELGLRLQDSEASFADDMNYVDAFRLWCLSAFDDASQRDTFLPPRETPSEWQAWLDSEIGVLDRI